MSSTLLLLAVLATAAADTAGPQAVVECTAQRLRPFVGPMGIRQRWPVAEEVPEHMAASPGYLLSDQGAIADGYMQTLYLDVAARAAYVVQQGGFAGFRTIYGPLPVASCAVQTG